MEASIDGYRFTLTDGIQSHKITCEINDPLKKLRQLTSLLFTPYPGDQIVSPNASGVADAIIGNQMRLKDGTMIDSSGARSADFQTSEYYFQGELIQFDKKLPNQKLIHKEPIKMGGDESIEGLFQNWKKFRLTNSGWNQHLNIAAVPNDAASSLEELVNFDFEVCADEYNRNYMKEPLITSQSFQLDAENEIFVISKNLPIPVVLLYDERRVPVEITQIGELEKVARIALELNRDQHLEIVWSRLFSKDMSKKDLITHSGKEISVRVHDNFSGGSIWADDIRIDNLTPESRVGDLIRQIEQRKGRSISRLKFRGQNIFHGQLKDFCLWEGCKLDVDFGEIQIIIATLTGKELPISISENSTCGEIKLKIEEAEGIPPEQQRLIFGGRQLEDHHSARAFKIKNGSRLHLVLRLRGGMMHISSGRDGFENPYSQHMPDTVHISLWMDHKVTIDVSDLTTIMDLKRRVLQHMFLLKPALKEMAEKLEGSSFEEEEVQAYQSMEENVSVRDWNVERVGVWLDSINLGMYKENFQHANIDGLQLSQLLREEAKKNLGVKKIHLYKLMMEIEKLNSSL